MKNDSLIGRHCGNGLPGCAMSGKLKYLMLPVKTDLIMPIVTPG
ncbi:MAG: hypothetical protein ACLUOI_34510 [Eisenbergiella sp.]